MCVSLSFFLSLSLSPSLSLSLVRFSPSLSFPRSLCVQFAPGIAQLTALMLPPEVGWGKRRTQQSPITGFLMKGILQCISSKNWDPWYPYTAALIAFLVGTVQRRGIARCSFQSFRKKGFVIWSLPQANPRFSNKQFLSRLKTQALSP